jgi:hypothetical protein
VSDAAPAADQAPNASTERPDNVQAPAAADKAPKRKHASGAAKRKRAKGSTPAKPASTGAVLNRELKELEDQLQALLVAPAVPMHMAGDHWPGDHIEQRAPGLAHQVVELARRNPAFRAQLQRLLSTSESGQLAFAAAAYLVPILVYYGLIPVPPPVRAQLQVPDRQQSREDPRYAERGSRWEEQRAEEREHWAGVGSDDGSTEARDGAFREQPPGTPGSPPAPGPPAPLG